MVEKELLHIKQSSFQYILPSTNVYNHQIISKANLPPSEVNKYLDELRSKRLIMEVFPKPDGISFTLYRITREGLNKIEN